MLEHVWREWGQWKACAMCGVIRRADGKNKPCPGVIRVKTREGTWRESRSGAGDVVHDAIPPRRFEPRCLCGHGMHRGVACEACGCERAAPDYVAEAEASGVIEHARDREAYLLQLREAQSELARSLGYTGPSRRGRTSASNATRRRCSYCTGAFLASRAHADTCSGACRQARSVALRLESDVDVPLASMRREQYSAERAAATGYGLLTSRDCYDADMRVRRAARRDRRRQERRAARVSR